MVDNSKSADQTNDVPADATGDGEQVEEQASMTAPTRGLFRATVLIEVGVRDLDHTVVRETLKWYGGRTPDTDPNLAESLARDQRLLAALLRHPLALREELLRNVVTELDAIRPTDEILEDIGGQALTDDHLLTELAPTLPTADVTFFQGCCEDDVFYDNTTFFQQAFKTTVGKIAIELVELITPPHTSTEH